MTTKKYRVDFVAHQSIVVQVREDEGEFEAVDVAEEVMRTKYGGVAWDFEDGGIEEVSQDEEAENEIYDDEDF